MRIQLQFAGTNRGDDTISHIFGSADACWHAALNVAWVRWQCFTDDGEVIYGRWEPVLPGKPFIDPRPGRLG